MTRRVPAWTWLAWPALALAALVIYWPALQGTFVWDDDRHITHPELQSVDGLVRIWTDIGATQQYYPVVHTAFWVQHRLWGDAPLGYHVVNVLLHALSAWLFMLVLGRLAVPGALLAGILFLVHPLQVESVAWITELKNTLSCVFYLLAARAYLRFDERRTATSWAAALVWFVLALGSKTVTSTLPVTLLAVFWWRRGTLELRRDVRPLVPFAVLGLISGVTTIWVEAVLIEARGSEFDLGPGERLLLAGRAAAFYAWKFVWPSGLAFSYERWQVSLTVWWQYLYPVIWVATAAILWRMRTRWRGPFTALVCFLVALAPALGFFNVYPFRFSYVADHFAYLASLPLLACAAAALTRAATRYGHYPRATEALAAVCLGVPLGLVSHTLAHDYRSGEALLRATIAREPAAWMAHGNLGAILIQDPERTDEGVWHVREALRLKPDLAEAHTNLGHVYARQGRLLEALAEFDQARRLEPRLAAGHNNACAMLRHLGRLAEASAACQRALALDPGNLDAHLNSGFVANGLGDPDLAIAHLAVVLQVRPTFAAARHQMGLARLATGDIDAAVRELERATVDDPRTPIFQNDLAVALQRRGKLDEAIRAFQQALVLDPDYAGAAFNLGSMLLRLGRVDESARYLERAVRADPRDAWAHNNLGVAVEAMGQRAEALRHFEMALALDPDLASARDNVARLRGGR